MNNENPSGSGAGSTLPQDAVLNEVLVNHREANLAAAGQPVEDADLALAKLLQEQERAFVMLAGADAAVGRYENLPPPPPGDGDANDTSLEGLTDEELALRLQQAEQVEFEQRLWALAGAVPGEEGAEEDDDDLDSVGVDPDNMSYEELTALGEVVGTVSTGLNEKQIAALPVKLYREVVSSHAQCSKLHVPSHSGEQRANGADAEEEQCAVCRLEYEGDDLVTVLPCKHYYHGECIGQWFVHKKVCPQCNKEVAGSEEVKTVTQVAPVAAGIVHRLGSGTAASVQPALKMPLGERRIQ